MSLGCDKNLVDSEMMITSLRKDGFTITDREEDAEIIVVNTCCFIGDAKEESINTLLEMASYKEDGKCRLLVAAGCLAQRYHEEIRTEIPEVDVIIGTMGYEEMGTTLRDALKEKGVVESIRSIDYLPTPLTDRDNTRRELCVSEDCRGLRQMLHLLYYPEGARSLPERSDGQSHQTGTASDGERCEGADPCCTGDDAVRNRSVWQEKPSGAFGEAFRGGGASLDPHSLLLSGGDHR